jgi:hypothetical protein
MVFKRDLTPIGGKRGRIVTNSGKGSAPQQSNLMSRLTNRYPAAPQPAPNAGSGMPPAPGGSIGPQPTAGMPPSGMPPAPDQQQ